MDKKNIPEQTNQFLDILFSYSLITSAPDTVEDMIVYGDILDKCVESKFLSPSLKTPLTDPAVKIFYQFFQLRKNMQSYLYHYTFDSAEVSCIMSKLLVSLTHKYIYLVEITDLDNLPPEIILDLLDSAEHFIQNRTYEPLLPEKRKVFWKSFVKLISSYEDHDEYLLHLDNTTFDLIAHDDIHYDITDVEFLISSHLENPDEDHKNPYRSLLATL